MYHFFLVIFVIIAVILIVLIMLQQNNGNSIGGGLDHRSLGDLFNSDNFNNSVTRFIVILAVLFFLFSLLLGNINSKYNRIYTKIDNQENLKKNR